VKVIKDIITTLLSQPEQSFMNLVTCRLLVICGASLIREKALASPSVQWEAFERRKFHEMTHLQSRKESRCSLERRNRQQSTPLTL
jgi:hypothetical protein